MFKKAGDDAFVDNNYRRLYPDFYSDEQNFVVDAKYKRFGEKNAGREDLYQLVTYMYCKKSENGAITPLNLSIIKFLGKMKFTMKTAWSLPVKSKR